MELLCNSVMCYWRYFLKILIIMKLTIVLLISVFLQQGFSLKAQNINISKQNASLKSILTEVRLQSGYDFFFENASLENAKPVSVNIRNGTLHEVLKASFKDQPFTYSIAEKTIVIRNGIVPISMVVNKVSQEGIKLSGTVKDSGGIPLAGATITIVGSTRGAISDTDGSFTIDAKATDKIRFEYLGMVSQTFTIENKRVFEVVLVTQESELGDAVVVGFGKQRQVSVIGSIASVSAKNIQMPVGNLSTSLAGQMAGIVAAQRTGEPGASSDFWIRGVTTFGNGNRPLVLVDGIERSLDLVDSEDLESVSILKDATATAVYGVRGANGVVLITTKRGKAGKPIVTARVESGILTPTILPKMANAEQFLDLYNDGFRSQFGTDFYSKDDIQMYLNGTDPDLYPNVNWMETIMKRYSNNTRANANISGGSESIKYYVSGTYYSEDGIYNSNKTKKYDPQIKWDRYNFRANVDINLFKGNTVSVNLANQYDVKNSPNSGDLWNYTFLAPPTVTPVRFSTGELAIPRDAGVNPYELLNERGDVQRFTNNMQSLVSITQDFSEVVTPGLQYNVKLAWDASTVTSNTRSKIPEAFSASKRDENGDLVLIPRNDTRDYLTLSNSNSGQRVTYFETSFTYDREFDNKHRVGGLFLFNRRERFNNFPGNLTNSFPYRNIGIAGRATYSYLDRYFTEVNFGYNGSENFSPNKRFGWFPSVAIGYMPSNEKYWEPLKDVVNTLKFKASYGQIGNDEIRGRRFAYNSEMLSSGGYTFGQGGTNGVSGIGVGYQGNPNVTWETSYKKNFGLEIEFFNQLNFKVDYFDEERKGIFIQRTAVPSIVGLTVDPFINLGELANKGFEVAMEHNKTFGSFRLSTRGNFTYNRNKLVYNDTPVPQFEYLNTLGKPLYQQFGLVADGFFQSEEEIKNSPPQRFGTVRVGDIKYKDINGDGQIDDNDRMAIGRTHVPEISYGMGFSLGWKNLDLSMFFQGAANVSYSMGGSAVYGFSGGGASTGGILEDVALNRWTPENPNAKYPRISINPNSNNNRTSTMRLYDSGYLRLKNFEIGYNLPNDLLSKTFIGRCRLYVQGVNVLTFSKFKLWDPELIQNMGAQYPNVRTISAGINMKF